jgi:hypothetical protein
MSDPNMNDKVRAVERLSQLFKMERFAYLGITGISLLMLLTSAGVLIVRTKADPATLTMLFGSSGLIAYSANRVLKMWDRAMNIVAGPETGESAHG